MSLQTTGSRTDSEEKKHRMAMILAFCVTAGWDPVRSCAAEHLLLEHGCGADKWHPKGGRVGGSDQQEHKPQERNTYGIGKPARSTAVWCSCVHAATRPLVATLASRLAPQEPSCTDTLGQRDINVILKKVACLMLRSGNCRCAMLTAVFREALKDECSPTAST